MGSAGSVEGESTLPSVADVHAAQFEDDFKKKTRRHEEILEKERRQCQVVGYQATAHYSQPLMEGKLDRSLGCLDEITSAYCADQRRSQGYSEVHLEQLASGGDISAICMLQDKATLACASEEGPIWIYNWRDGEVVCQFRDQNPNGPDWGGGNREACRVRRLCVASQDNRLLVSGDEHGFVSVWDLHGPDLAVEARLHEKACSGLRVDYPRSGFVTTGEDCYVILYDLAQEQVRDRAVPAPLACGSGIPNTCLELGGDRYRNLILVGGADGKLRLWDAAGPVTHQHTVNLGAVTPTQCLLAPNGWQLLVTASLGDSAFCGTRPERGGLYVYDVRKLADGGSSGALIAKYPSGSMNSVDTTQASRVSSLRSRSSVGGMARGSIMSSASRMIQGIGIGALDVVLTEEEGSNVALCLMDNVIKAFDLGSGQEVEETHHQAIKGTAAWEVDITAQNESEWVSPCALAAADRFVVVGTTAPAVSVWRRPVFSDYGHSDFQRPPRQPMELRATCLPLALNSDTLPKEVLLHDPALRPGDSLANVQAALDADRLRASRASLADRLPTGGSLTVDALANRPEDILPGHSVSGVWRADKMKGIAA